MAFNSNTKSWQACNASQKRECKALAVFTVIKKYKGDLFGQIRSIKSELTLKIKQLKKELSESASLTDLEMELIATSPIITQLNPDISGIETFEHIFSKIESFIKISNIPILSSSELKALLKSGELSKLFKVADKFQWSGSSNKLPIGKSSSDVGITDALLDKLMNKSEIHSLLTSWLEAGDRNWWNLIKPEIEIRKRELSYEKRRSSPDNRKIQQLEDEIKKLERDWTL